MKKIAFVGIRGIPVVYSGFESFVEDLIQNTSGFEYFVYCRSRYVQKKVHLGARLIQIPTIYLYKLETFVHSLLSTLHAVFFLKPHLIFYLSVGNAPFMLFPKIMGIKTVINVNGMDWSREKWGIIGRLYLRFSSFCAVILADCIVTDSHLSRRYYKDKFQKNTTYVPYMSNGYIWKKNESVLKNFKVKKGEYFVWAGRLVPDNQLDTLIGAFLKINTNKKLIVMGDDNYFTKYKKSILKIFDKDNRIIWIGFVRRDIYLNLLYFSYAYVETKQSGGTHPTLIDALTYAPSVICNDFTSNNLKVRNDVVYYKTKNIDSLCKAIKKSLTNNYAGSIAPISKIFSSKNIAFKYKQIFNNVLSGVRSV